MKEPKWDKANAPILKDEGSMLDRQKSRLAQRAEEARQRGLEAVQRAEARAKELTCQQVSTHDQATSTGSSPRPEAPQSLTERVRNAASSYVSCLGLGTPDPTRLKRLMDEIEDLPQSSQIKRPLESKVNALLVCENFEAGMRLHAELKALTNS